MVNIILSANISNPLFADPLLINPDARGSGFDILKNFLLQKDSPCIGSGIKIENNGGSDLFGNPLTGSDLPSVGVHEYIKP